MKRFLAGLVSLVAIGGLIVGIPLALIFLAGNPIPSLDELNRALTTPDYGGEFLIGTLLPIVAWVAWASFAIGFLVELPAQIRNVPAPKLPLLGFQQHGAAVLIGAVIVMFTGLAALAPASSADAVTFAQSSSQSQGQDSASAEAAVRAHLAAEESDRAVEKPVEMMTVMGETERVIVPGDTLWGIAQEELGDGSRYPEIFQATKDDAQPVWGAITNPNLIHPGQHVDIPTAVQVPVPVPEPELAPQGAPGSETLPTTDDAGSATDAGAGTAQGADAQATDGKGDLSGLGIATQSSGAEGAQSPATQAGDPAASSTASEDDWIDELFNVRTAGGIGAIAAAGLLALLGIRRRNQRRNRKPGQRISMPDGAASTMELELRAVENPMGMEDVDHALRHLAIWAQDTGSPLPQLYAVRLAEQEIALYLDAPASLPTPFVDVADDQQAWTIDPTLLPPLERVPSAPYPALVTLGQDVGNAHVLVDLEHIGALNLTGDDDAIDGVLTALAVELSTSQWAEDLQITLVGIAPGLPRALETGRVRHVDDVDTLLRNLRGQAEATKTALGDLGVSSIEEARSLSVDAEAWIPEIVLLGELPDEAARLELAELVTHLPRLGIAAITAGHLSGGWTLHLTSATEAELRLPEATLPITPQIINATEYSRILDLFKATEPAAGDGPAWTSQVDVDEIAIDEIPEPSTEPLPAVDMEGDDDGDEWKTILQQLLTPKGTGETAGSDQIDGEAFDGNPVVQLHAAPHVQILGTVGIHNARGEEPRTPQTSEVNRSAVARATELIAFLALHPGANAVEVHDALWPGRDPSGKAAQQSRNGLTTKARKWLGNSPAGELYLPPVGAGGYRLVGVRSDWDVWLELIGADVTATSTSSLVAALRLVKGQPFSGVKDKYYVWAERTRQDIIAAVGDASHELATRSLRSGDTNHARLAAAVGRQIDPINEIYWRDALRAEHQAGDMAGFDRVVTQLEELLESFEDGYEAEPETQELIEAIRARHAVAS